jgi:hypothetical protein
MERTIMQHRPAASCEATPEVQWRRLLDALGDAGRQVLAGPRAQTTIAQDQAVRYLQRVLRGMLLTAIEVDDADYPVLVRLFDSYLPYGNSNPDCLYLHATVSPRHTYRISGSRGTARIVEVQAMDGHFVAGPNHKGLVTLPDLRADNHGNLEIVLSATPQPGNWLRLDPEARWLYLRQYFYDWQAEQPAQLTIERVGAHYPPPLASGADIACRIERLIGWIPSWYRHLERRVEGYYDSPPDRLQFTASAAGMDGLLYGKGHVRLEPGQAAILEFRAPECRYWSIQVMNDFWESQEFDVRQTSLNGQQAQLDPDGVFRGVIAVADPGVPNWLDPVGHLNSLICARVLYARSSAETRLRIVPLKSLRAELHPDTPTLTSAERSESLHRRMLGVRHRYPE